MKTYLDIPANTLQASRLTKSLVLLVGEKQNKNNSVYVFQMCEIIFAKRFKRWAALTEYFHTLFILQSRVAHLVEHGTCNTHGGLV